MEFVNNLVTFAMFEKTPLIFIDNMLVELTNIGDIDHLEKCRIYLDICFLGSVERKSQICR